MKFNLKSYFEFDVRTTVVYAIFAAIMGYVSFVINNTAIAAVAAVVVMVLLTVAMRAIWKIKEGARWWLGNGGIVYIFMWMIVWTILYNSYAII